VGGGGGGLGGGGVRGFGLDPRTGRDVGCTEQTVYVPGTGEKGNLTYNQEPVTGRSEDTELVIREKGFGDGWGTPSCEEEEEARVLRK